MIFAPWHICSFSEFFLPQDIGPPHWPLLQPILVFLQYPPQVFTRQKHPAKSGYIMFHPQKTIAGLFLRRYHVFQKSKSHVSSPKDGRPAFNVNPGIPFKKSISNPSIYRIFTQHFRIFDGSQVWLLCVVAKAGQLQGLLGRLSRRGCLRWDLAEPSRQTWGHDRVFVPNMEKIGEIKTLKFLEVDLFEGLLMKMEVDAETSEIMQPMISM